MIILCGTSINYGRYFLQKLFKLYDILPTSEYRQLLAKAPHAFSLLNLLNLKDFV